MKRLFPVAPIPNLVFMWFVLVYSLAGFVDANAQGSKKYLLKNEELFHIDLESYDFEYGIIPTDVKKRMKYFNGKWVGVEEYKEGKVVFSYNFDIVNIKKYDSTTIDIEAVVYNDRNEVVKKYRINNKSSIVVESYESDKPNNVYVMRKVSRDTSNRNFAFLSKIKSIDALLNSPELKTIENSTSAYVSEEYRLNDNRQILKYIQYSSVNSEALVQVDFQYSKDGLTKNYICYVNDKINDRIKVEYMPNCYYKGTKRNKLKRYEWVALPRGNGDPQRTFVDLYIYGNDCKLQMVEESDGNSKAKYTFEFNANDNWVSKKVFGYDGVTLNTFYSRQYNEKGLMTFESGRSKGDTKPMIFIYKYENK